MTLKVSSRSTPEGDRRPLFSRETYASRRRAVQLAMQQTGIDLLLVAAPENIYYLTGLDHFGYFALHLLVVPAAEEAVLIARRMERVTVEHDVPDLHFVAYGDDADLGQHCLSVLKPLAPPGAVVGWESKSTYLPINVVLALKETISDVRWVDTSELVVDLRLAQAPEELEVTRAAAHISDLMVAAAIETAGEGVEEQAVAEAMVSAMIGAGGEPTAYWPFVRSTRRLNEDHTTWTDYSLGAGDSLFLELSGSIGRYHAPIGRLFFVRDLPDGAASISEVCLAAFEAARNAARPGAESGQVYDAWQAVVDEAGLPEFRRHHCGYATGIGFPPTWSGAGIPRGLRTNGTMVLREGMVFHLMSWMMGTGRGDYFVSDPVVITDGGAERLTKTAQAPWVL